MNVPATALDLGTLPGATRRLWNHALRILDAAGAAYGREFDWTWGGGTVMAMRHRHRRSKDVDLFVPNAQYLPYLSPRLSDAAQQRGVGVLIDGVHLAVHLQAVGRNSLLALRTALSRSGHTGWFAPYLRR